MTDLLAALIACAWMTAVGLMSYRAGLRRGQAQTDAAWEY